MPQVTLDGLTTNYVLEGSGPCVLMMAPRAFDSTLSSWSKGKWGKADVLKQMSKEFTVLAYDRRECGLSGGRVEALSWKLYAQQAKLLIEKLNFDPVYVVGACKGVGIALEFVRLYPASCAGLVLAHPVGGFRWREKMLSIFSSHLRFVHAHGLDGIREHSKPGVNFLQNPELGPWCSVISRDEVFATCFVQQNFKSYVDFVELSAENLFPDTFVSGPRACQLSSLEVPAFIWPGDDASHATSSAHQLRELLPRAEFWDVSPEYQTPVQMLDQMQRFFRGCEKPKRVG